MHKAGGRIRTDDGFPRLITNQVQYRYGTPAKMSYESYSHATKPDKVTAAVYMPH